MGVLVVDPSPGIVPVRGNRDRLDIISDLDGTITDCRHRQPLATAAQWDDFHAACPLDGPREEVCEFLRRSCKLAGYELVIMTGRPITYAQATVDWLAKHELAEHTVSLNMRAANNFQSSPDLKLAMVEMVYGSVKMALEQVAFVLEDRDKTTDFWRRLGFACWQVQPGGY